MLRKVLVTFDIDGTLLLADEGRKIQLQSIIHAITEFFGKPPVIDCSNPMNLFQFMYHGITDSAAFKSMFVRRNFPFKQKDINKIIEIYDDFYIKQDLGHVIEFPGVRNCIRQLKEMENVYIAVASGSTERTAIYKMENANQICSEIKPFCGAFGDQNDLRKSCIEQAKKLTEKRIKSKIDEVVHIGDTPGDTMSAIFAHSTPIAVETGEYRKKDFPHFGKVIKNMKVGLDTIIKEVKRLQHEKGQYSI